MTGVPVARHQFQPLDLLRGIAAVAVLGWHIEPVRGTLLHSGYLCVDLFFLISGFIVAHAYERRLLSNEMSLARFAKTRAIRLYPLYAIGTLLGFAVTTLSLSLDGLTLSELKRPLVSLSAAVFLLPVPRGLHVASFELNLPAWSLLFEVLANVAYAVFLVRASNRVLYAIAGVSALLLVAVAAQFGHVDVGAVGWQMLFGLPRIGYTFAVGVLLYRFWLKRQAAPSSRVHWLLPPLALVTLIALPVALLPDGSRPFYDVAAIVVVMPLITVAALLTQLPPMARAAATVGADMSYPLYMIHVPLIMIAEAMIAVGAIGAPAAFTLAAVAAVVSSMLLDRLYDRPVRRWLTQAWVGSRRPVPRAVVV